MGTDRDAVLEKIRKLIAKAEDKSVTSAESATFMAAALKLMTLHGLDEMEARQVKGEKDNWSLKYVCHFGRYTTEHQLAYTICVTFYNVKGITNKDRQAGTKRLFTLNFFGEPHNADVAAFTFNSLLNAFDNLWVSYRARTKCAAKERLTYLTGVANGYTEKLRQSMVELIEERDKQRGHSSTGLQLLSARDKMLQAYQEKHKTSPRNSKFVTPTGSRSTLEDGVRDGKSLNLNRSLGDGPKKIEKQA